MTLTARMWRGVGRLTLAGLLTAGGLAGAAEGDRPPLAEQLADLGRQALDQGRPDQAAIFFRNALDQDPANAEARRGLEHPDVLRIALQDPVPDAPAPPPPAPEAPDQPEGELPPAPGFGEAGGSRATLESASELLRVQTQQVVADIEARLVEASRAVAAGQPELAKDILRLARSVAQTAEGLDPGVRDRLGRRIQAQYLDTVRQQERIELERADQIRRENDEASRARVLDALIRRQETVKALMQQFDNLIAEGQYRVLSLGGTGNIAQTTQPFITAREQARAARGLIPEALAPRAGMFYASTTGYLSQSLAFEELKENRFMATMQDVERAMVPFPDTLTLEYPPITQDLLTRWEQRAERFGRPVSLVERDPNTQTILRKLDEPISMPFPNETPLEDVLKHIKNANKRERRKEKYKIERKEIKENKKEKNEKKKEKK